jgi:hypothetical protein
MDAYQICKLIREKRRAYLKKIEETSVVLTADHLVLRGKVDLCDQVLQEINAAGPTYLAVVFGYWAKGATEDEAVDKVMERAGKSKRSAAYQVYKVHFETVIDEAGGFLFPEGADPPKLVEEHKPKKARR